jgi:hypothetical protein
MHQQVAGPCGPVAGTLKQNLTGKNFPAESNRRQRCLSAREIESTPISFLAVDAGGATLLGGSGFLLGAWGTVI